MGVLGKKAILMRKRVLKLGGLEPLRCNYLRGAKLHTDPPAICSHDNIYLLTQHWVQNTTLL